MTSGQDEARVPAEVVGERIEEESEGRKCLMEPKGWRDEVQLWALKSVADTERQVTKVE